MSAEQMRQKLREWRPTWNIDRFTDAQIAEMYQKERKKLVDEIVRRYENS